MESWHGKLRAIAQVAVESAVETVWPTRCAICDEPGSVLCGHCARELPHVDWWRACRRCGSPFGFTQCDTCNPVTLSRMGYSQLPFSACASAVLFTDETGRIVRVFKDQGEQRLANVMAAEMARLVPPSWSFDAVAFVPATLYAYRYRGFDHAQLIAQAVADALEAPCLHLLERPKTRDQRQLTGAQRVSNLKGRFAAEQTVATPSRVLLVDDVFTTGSTMCAAADALRGAGAEDVLCLTFARV